MKKLLKIFSVTIVICLIAILTIKLCFTFNKGAVSPVAIEDIKSVQIINLDRSTNRREGYEKRLKKAYGDEFLGQKIGDAIRLSGTDGVKDLVIIELDDKGNEVKNVDIAKLKAKISFLFSCLFMLCSDFETGVCIPASSLCASGPFETVCFFILSFMVSVMAAGLSESCRLSPLSISDPVLSVSPYKASHNPGISWMRVGYRILMPAVTASAVFLLAPLSRRVFLVSSSIFSFRIRMLTSSGVFPVNKR